MRRWALRCVSVLFFLESIPIKIKQKSAGVPNTPADFSVSNGDIQRCDQACKPSSVVNSHLSWPGVTAAARCHLHGTRRADAYCPSAVLLRIGFAEPCSSPHAGELLPRLSTLTHQKVCGISLLHFPWGRPRRPLAVIPALWSSDFPQTPTFA